MTATRSRPVAPAKDRPAAEEPPFPGPRPFSRHEASGFFGRSDEVAELASLVRCHAVVLLYAESGVGKSSLVDAGLRPRLERRAGAVTMTGRVKGPPLADDAADEGNVFVANLVRSLSLGTAPASEDPAASAASASAAPPRLAEALAGAPWGDAPLRLVVVDQLEEIFTLHPNRWKDRRAFFEQVQEAVDADPRLRFVLSVRADYLSRLYPYTNAFHDDLRTRYGLERLRPRDAVEAILEPSARSSRAFTAEAAEALAEQLRAVPSEQPGGPPVAGEFVDPGELQIVCRDLWQRVPPGPITAQQVRDLAELGEVHARFYDGAVAQTVRSARVKEARLRRWFATTLITPAGTRGFLFRDRTHTAGLPNHVVDALEQQQVIRSEQRGTSRFYELTHDRLIPAVAEANRRWFGARARRRRRRVATLTAVLVVTLGVVAAAALLASAGEDGRPAGPPPVATLVSLNESGVVPDGGTVRVPFRLAEPSAALISVELDVTPATESAGQVTLLDPAGRQVPATRIMRDGTLELAARLPVTGRYQVVVESRAGTLYWVSGLRADWLPGGGDGFTGEVTDPDVINLHPLDEVEGDLVLVTIRSGDVYHDASFLGATESFYADSYDDADNVSQTLLANPQGFLLEVYLEGPGAYAVEITVPEVVPLAAGRTVTGTLEPGRFDIYSFEPPVGHVALLRMTSTGVAPDLQVFTPGAVAAEAVALDAGTDAASSFAALPVTEPGMHYVIARPYDEETEDGGGLAGGTAAGGSYRLSYSTSPLPQ